MIRHSIKSISTKTISIRCFNTSCMRLAKGDESTIDSFRLPSQTSINEWEFKYDYIPKTSEPKIPPISKEAVKQDIAHEKAKSVERELFAKESNASVKVEANNAEVLHGGETIGTEPEYLEDISSQPIDVTNPNAKNSTKFKKSVNHDKYVQSSVNPEINSGDIHNLSEGDVDHKIENVKQSPVVEDLEHDNLNHEGQTKKDDTSSSSNTGLGILAVLGLGGAGYYYFSSSSSKAAKK
ncbi:unnamed protein product [Candida verbasci]|uniref:Uncharacterized protein n=1 Tax=Candida verbasci TaxID=1227364 RepID=A0A9W4XCN0_9ASCO|nr:unnamed protein product [Candida verbasci]